MLCSEAELGLSSDHGGIWIMPPDSQVGKPVANYVPGGDVIDVTTAANRWDLNGIAWLSREVAAQRGIKCTFPQPEQTNSSKPAPIVSIARPELVARYLLAHLAVDLARPSPSWLKEQLQAAGIRSINVVVDITNFVMLELAQPLHAFDADKVSGDVGVRTAKAGETLTTLDGVRRKLNPADLMIVDGKGPIGFAGIMGGAATEVDGATTSIYLEAASFKGPTVRKTAIRHGLRTDASARFERRIPVQAPLLGLNRAIELLEQYAGANLLGASADTLGREPKHAEVKTATVRVNTVLGLHLTATEIAQYLAKLEFNCVKEKEGVAVTIPWWRQDIMHADDVAEEVIKLVGYEKLPSTLPAWRPRTVEFDRRWRQLRKGREILSGSGLFEVLTYSFISEEQIENVGWKAREHLALRTPYRASNHIYASPCCQACSRRRSAIVPMLSASGCSSSRRSTSRTAINFPMNRYV